MPSATAAPELSPTPLPSPTPTPVPAGLIPANVALTVTGTPVADAAFLEKQIRAALTREIRPSLRPGAAIRYGTFVPWPLQPLPAGIITAVNVNVTIVGNGDGETVNGWTTVALNNDATAPPFAPSFLFYSDDPEHVQSEGLLFAGTVDAARPARLYYYHDQIGLPRGMDVVLSATAPSRVHVVYSGSGPDLDVMSVGHAISRDMLTYEPRNEGIVVDLLPGKPFVLRHSLALQGELVAGVADITVLMGAPVRVAVIASLAGSDPFVYLYGLRLPGDGHNRHGVFSLTDYGATTLQYVAGGPEVATSYGGRNPTPRNVDPNDPGRDYGDYGVVHRITFLLSNPTTDQHTVYLYERALGGPVRSTFVVDGNLKELGCIRLPSARYLIAPYLLPPGSSGASTLVTMTDGGSNYPLEVGVTETYPTPVAPQQSAPDGCFPKSTPTPSPSASPAPAESATPFASPSPLPSPTPSGNQSPS